MKLVKEIKWNTVKCLVLAAYYAGQATGLEGKTFSHADAIRERKNLISLI